MKNSNNKPQLIKNRLTLAVQKSIITELDKRLFTNNTVDIYLRKPSTYALIIHLLSLFAQTEKNSKTFYFSTSAMRSTFTRFTDLNKERIYEVEYLMDVFINHGIIKDETKGNSFSKKSSTYHFTENFLDCIAAGQYEETTILISDSKFITDLFIKEIEPACQQQFDFLNDKNLTIDIIGATNKLRQMLNDGEINQSKYVRHINNITNFKNKQNIWITQDKNTGRIYSIFTNLKRELRQFILYKGKKLQSVDLKSAHPYLLASTLRFINDDCMKFYNTVINDDIYLVGMNKAIEHNYKGELTRNNFKIEMMFAIYKATMRANSIFIKIFIKDYKGFATELTKLKDLNNTLNLAQFLQQREADLFIPVANKFKKCLSLHDGIYFIESDKDNLLKELNKSFKSFNYEHYTLTNE